MDLPLLFLPGLGGVGEHETSKVVSVPPADLDVRSSVVYRIGVFARFSTLAILAICYRERRMQSWPWENIVSSVILAGFDVHILVIYML